MTLPLLFQNKRTIFSSAMLAVILVLTFLSYKSADSSVFTPNFKPDFRPNAAAGNTSGISHNWAGYAATGGNFTSVMGTWTVPQVGGSSSTSVDATWVGIGGMTRNDLIQSGTQDIVDRNGQVTSTAFFEVLPRSSEPLPVTVNGGDQVQVSIMQISTNQWQISFVNKTKNLSHNRMVTYSSSLSSAEWIEEDPSMRSRLTPLANFGTVQFTGGSTMRNGTQVTIAQANSQTITMVNDVCETLASASSLGSDGASFAVTRTSASDTQGLGYGRGFGRAIPDCTSTTSSSTSQQQADPAWPWGNGPIPGGWWFPSFRSRGSR